MGGTEIGRKEKKDNNRVKVMTDSIMKITAGMLVYVINN